MLEKNVAKRATIIDAVRHPFFRRESSSNRSDAGNPCIGQHEAPAQAVQGEEQHHVSIIDDANLAESASVKDASDAAEKRAVQMLYERASTFVRRGRRVQESFHGVEGIKRARAFSVAYALHSAFPDDAPTPSASLPDVALNSCSSSDGTASVPALRMPQSHWGERASGSSSSSDGSSSDRDTGNPRSSQQEDPLTCNIGSASRHKKRKHRKTATKAPMIDARDAGKIDEAVMKQLASSLVRQDGVLTIEGTTMRSLPAVVEQSADAIRMLILKRNSLSSTGGVRFALFSQLLDVSIVVNSLKDFPLELLAATTLQRIDLSGNFLTSIPDELSEHPCLERLSLNSNRISAIDDAKPFTGKRLRHVRLSNNFIQRFPGRGFEGCVSLELVMDDVPSLVEAWTKELIFVHRNVSVLWNDIFPTRVMPSLPVFILTKRLSLCTQHVVRVLNLRHTVVPQKALDFYSCSRSIKIKKASSSASTDAESEPQAKRPPLLSSRCIVSSFIVSTEQIDEHARKLQRFIEEKLLDCDGIVSTGERSGIVLCMNKEESFASDVRAMLLAVARVVMARAQPALTESEAMDYAIRACGEFYA
jgi:hypothetical protein